MGTLSNISSRQAIAAFQLAGWTVVRQRGSHIVLAKAGASKSISLPERRECTVGLLRAAIRIAGLSVDEFLALL